MPSKAPLVSQLNLACMQKVQFLLFYEGQKSGRANLAIVQWSGAEGRNPKNLTKEKLHKQPSSEWREPWTGLLPWTTISLKQSKTLEQIRPEFELRKLHYALH